MRKLVVFNAESSYLYFKDEEFRSALLGTSALFCDSMSLSLALKFSKIEHERLHGPDFMDNYLRNFPHHRIMIVGGTAKAHERIKQKYQLKNVFFIDQQINLKDLSLLFDQVMKFEPHIVFVCLGLRKQEIVVDQICKRFSTNRAFDKSVAIGVGAAVDFLGETKIRSGRIWQRLGLEWLPRLIREPRMGPRVLRSFVGCILTLRTHQRFEQDQLKFGNTFDA